MTPYKVTTLHRGDGSNSAVPTQADRSSQIYNSSQAGYEYIDQNLRSGIARGSTPAAYNVNTISTQPENQQGHYSNQKAPHYDTPVTGDRMVCQYPQTGRHYENTGVVPARNYLRPDPRVVAQPKEYGNNYMFLNDQLENPYEEINPADVKTLERHQQVNSGLEPCVSKYSTFYFSKCSSFTMPLTNCNTLNLSSTATRQITNLRFYLL